MRYSHSGAAKMTTLAADITAVSMTFSVADGSGYPDGSIGPFFVTLGKGTLSYEKILCSARSGNTFTVWTDGIATGRGADGTVAQTHSAPEEIEHTWTAVEADLASAHQQADSGVHGVTGDVVGTTDVQVLTGKTIDGDSNTLQDIPQAAVTGLVAALAAKIAASIVNAKGDLIVGTADDAVARLAAGANGHVLTADSAQATGVKWAAVPSSPRVLARVTPSGVTSFNFGAAMVGYSLYRIMYRAKSSASAFTLRARLRVAGVDASGGDYYDYGGGSTYWGIAGAGSVFSVGEILIANPSDTEPTVFDARFTSGNSGGIYATTQTGGYHGLSAAYDDLTIYSPAGELITGEFILVGYGA
jgi:hypothetical protein